VVLGTNHRGLAVLVTPESMCGVYRGVWTSRVQGKTWGMRLIGRLIANTIVGLILLFLTNLFLSDEVPINLLTIVICAIGGVVGWLVIVILHLLGVAF
jgi:pro-sigmaK processing inhibitor BofA